MKKIIVLALAVLAGATFNVAEAAKKKKKDKKVVKKTAGDEENTDAVKTLI